MRFAKILVALIAFAGSSLLAGAVDLAVNDAPYSPIVARNIFGLLPIPTNPPVDPNPTPVTPPPKITPNGFMNLFNVPQVLFKVAYPPAAGQPAHDQSYVLAEGESQDNIEVTKIDQGSGMITFNNNGNVQELPLAAAPKITTPVSPITNPGGGIGGGPSGGPGGGMPGGIPPPVLGGPRGPRGVANPGAASQADNGGVPDISANSGNIVNGVYNPGAQQQQQLSPEAQALLIENNYLQAKQKNDPSAGLFPPTPLRGQADASLNGEAGNGTGNVNP